MKNLVKLLFISFAFFNFLSGCENEVTSSGEDPEFAVSSGQILINGNNLFLKGMGYQPVPVGQHPNDPPNGDYFTANYASIYRPDVDRMRAMNVNAIKIYSWYPDRDHNDFLSYCYNGGVNPIYVAVGYFMPPGSVIGQFTEKLNAFKMIANATKNNPAVIGYMLGNENVGNDVNNREFWTKLNEISQAIKVIAPKKLTFTGLVDDGMISVRAGDRYMTSLDVWGINVFRGKTLGDFYTTYRAASNKPVFITELGFPSSVRTSGVPHPMPNNGIATAMYAGAVLREVKLHSTPGNPSGPVAGVFWFMFCDEWWKQECPSCYAPINQPCVCTKSTHDYCKNAFTDNFPGKYWDEEWFGIYTAERVPRAAVDTIKSVWR